MPFQQMNKLRALVEVFHDLFGSAFWKFGHIGLDAFILRRESQTLKEIGRFGRVGALGEADALTVPNDRKQPFPLLVAEEMIQADVENHGDSSQRRQSGNEFAI